MSAETKSEPAREKPWRMFCAVELPHELRARSAEHIARLRAASPESRASWNLEDKLHITLKFLGEIETDRVPALSRAAERAASGAQPFTLGLNGAGAFPTRGSPRVLWFGIEDASRGLAALHSMLEDECAREGFAREERAFHPHLTIARIRSPQGARQLAELHRQMGFELMEFPVTELVVMRSELGPGGSRYTVVARHELSGK